MGEERLMFDELLGDLGSLTAWELQKPLQEIASGTSAFGPMDEWHDWYHYLLGQLVPRGHESFVSSVLESLVTGFMAIYPNGIHTPPYKGFEGDVLNTLGRCMMDPRCWNGDEVVLGTMLRRSNNNPKKVWLWWDASGDFSASMFLCLKYLPPSLVPGWLTSVLAIRSPHWRAQVLVWLVGAHDMLRGVVRWPSEFLIEARPSVGWEWSHCLQPELATAEQAGAAPVDSFLPEPSRSAALSVAKVYFTEEVFLTWLDSIAQVPYLQAELAEIPSTFERLYVPGRPA